MSFDSLIVATGTITFWYVVTQVWRYSFNQKSHRHFKSAHLFLPSSTRELGKFYAFILRLLHMQWAWGKYRFNGWSIFSLCYWSLNRQNTPDYDYVNNDLRKPAIRMLRANMSTKAVTKFTKCYPGWVCEVGLEFADGIRFCGFLGLG